MRGGYKQVVPYLGDKRIWSLFVYFGFLDFSWYPLVGKAVSSIVKSLTPSLKHSNWADEICICSVLDSFFALFVRA